MDLERATKLLSGTEVFANLDARTLGTLAEQAVGRTVAKGETIFRQGEEGRSLYVVVEGCVKVTVSSGSGGEMLLATLHPPQVFGELAVVDNGPRSATATATEPTTLLGLDRDALLDVLHRYPTPVGDLLKTLGGLIRRLTEQASDLVFLDLHGRVAKLLVNEAERSGTQRGELVVELGLTQTDLAEMVGGSRQSFNQILHAFARRDWIELRGPEIAILDPNALRHRAGL